MNNKRMPTGNGPCHAHTLANDTLKARLILQGPAGTGKTYSSLLLAYGLCKDFNKVAVIETSYRATEHYRYLGAFRSIQIDAPFHSEKFLDALEHCASAGMEVILIDSLSAEWTGSLGTRDRMKEENCLHYHEALLNAIRHSPSHIIATLETEEAYVLTNSNGKPSVERLGLAPLQQKGIHYHFDTVLSLDNRHTASCLKNPTSFFEEHNNVLITEELASLFPSWLSEQVSQLLCPEGRDVSTAYFTS
jgi:hypothetical protein